MASVSSSLTEFAQSIFSYNTNIMLAALISLLLVVLFVLLLHAYAKCFFPHPRPRRRRTRRSSVAVSYLLHPSRLSLFDLAGAPPSKGLDPAAISKIPLFVYGSETPRAAAPMEECAICLSEFEDRELGRRLPKCSHGFHLECIDMWLDSHANCPVCRAPVVCDAANCPDAAESGRAGGIGPETDRNCEIQSNEGQNGQSLPSSSSSSSSFDPPLMSLGASLKRMLSKNVSEGRIFPSSNGVELDV